MLTLCPKVVTCFTHVNSFVVVVVVVVVFVKTIPFVLVGVIVLVGKNNPNMIKS